MSGVALGAVTLVAVVVGLVHRALVTVRAGRHSDPVRPWRCVRSSRARRTLTEAHTSPPRQLTRDDLARELPSLYRPLDAP